MDIMLLSRITYMCTNHIQPYGTFKIEKRDGKSRLDNAIHIMISFYSPNLACLESTGLTGSATTEII